MVRYSVIDKKRRREIVLLRGGGCVYRKCAFCDYHLDYSLSAADNYAVNAEALAQVVGIYGELEVINSGSVFELDADTLELIKTVCRQKNISIIHFEAHYLYRDRLEKLRSEFGEFTLKLKLGLETFDYAFRENVLHKGIDCTDPKDIARGFDEANLIVGISGQTVGSMCRDIELGLKYFERICVNVMTANTSKLVPDDSVISAFLYHIYPDYKDNDRVDILLENTDFGVGA